MQTREVPRESLSPAMFIGVRGSDIISFGSGQPDLPPPAEAYRALRDYKGFEYGLIQGATELREELSASYTGSTAESFVITNGASEAIDTVLRTIGRTCAADQRKVLITRPYYYSYPHIIRYAGLEPVYTETVDGRIDLADFSNKITGCSAAIINSPANPTGRVQPVETLKQIEKLTEKLGVFLISDEVYKDLIYVNDHHVLKGPHVVTINSFSKTYALCGFRIGYLWSENMTLVDQVIEMKTHTSMNTNILGQEMALAALSAPSSFISDQLEIWHQRRDLIYSGLSDLGLDLWKPEGAFYVLPKVEDPYNFVNDLFQHYRVITYLGDWFGAPDRVRLSYALDAQKIDEGLNRINNYLAHRNVHR